MITHTSGTPSPTTVKISGVVSNSDVTAKLGFEIWLDQQCVLSVPHVQHTMEFVHHLVDTDGEHVLKFVLKNKLSQHTVIDEHGVIMHDARLNISDVGFEDIKLRQILFDQAVYTHDENGNKTQFQDRFYGDMGCNGVVSLKFTTPIYLWLLEYM